MTSLPALKPYSAAALLALALAAPLAPAQAAGPMAAEASHHGPGLSSKALTSIGATAAQISSIQAIQTQLHTDLQALHTAAGSLHLQLAQALAAATVDATAAESIRQKMLAQHDAASLRTLQAQLQIAALLTPAQRQQLLTLMQQHPGRGPGHMRMGAGPGQNG